MTALDPNALYHYICSVWDADAVADIYSDRGAMWKTIDMQWSAIVLISHCEKALIRFKINMLGRRFIATGRHSRLEWNTAPMTDDDLVVFRLLTDGRRDFNYEVVEWAS